VKWKINTSSIRVRKHFALLPTVVGQWKVWLQFYYVKYQIINVPYEGPKKYVLETSLEPFTNE
jgi:hypothetical protein